MMEQADVRTGYVHTRANELYQELRTFILQSRPGTLLASENALARKHHISRMTARKVLQQLETDGLVERRRGIGSFVKGKRTVTLLLPCPGFLQEEYQTSNDVMFMCFQGAMKAAMDFNMRLETLPVAPVNNPDFNLNNIDYEQLSEIGSHSLIISSAYFCKLYQFFSSKHAKVAIISSQYEHYGYRHYRNDFYTVDADMSGALREILNYLFMRGKRRIALVKCNVAEKKYPLNNSYTKWCAVHDLPEIFESFPGESQQSSVFSDGLIADMFERTHFDALIFQHNGFRNVSGRIQEVLGLPPEIPVFGFGFRRQYAPGLEPFPCCTVNSYQLGYEAVRILADAPLHGVVRTYPYEFHDLPADWSAGVKKISGKH